MRTLAIDTSMIPAAALLLKMDPKDLEARLRGRPKSETSETDPRQELLTIKEIAFRGSFSGRHVQRLIAENRLKAVRFGRRCIRVPLKEWQKFSKGGK
jgi:excisionase family DNA binding protein